MPTWGEVAREINLAGNIDQVRWGYLNKLHLHTKRNIIAYYSAWLQRPSNNFILMINDEDINGFMQSVNNIDRNLGVDLILHTPGGNIEALDSIVCYLRRIFGNNIRAIIPQLAMSAGTMLACSCMEIIMGKQSSLGAIDPQFNGLPAYRVIEEFYRAISESRKNPASIPFWQVIIGKYPPTFLSSCQKTIDWSQEAVKFWITTSGMFSEEEMKDGLAGNIAKKLAEIGSEMGHSLHIDIERLRKNIGLKVTELEEDQTLQDLVLSIHHAFMHTFSLTTAAKIIENHKSIAYVRFDKTPS
jgi:membrane-bound ClpP family serine protease